MALIRWNPTRTVLDFDTDVDRLFDGFFDRSLFRIPAEDRKWNPAVDIRETENEYTVLAELPGLDKDNVKISYEDGIVTLRGEKKLEKEDKRKNYHRVERSYGTFERSFRLPASVEVDKIKASFKDGVLNLQLPKTENAKPKEIPIAIA